MTEELSLGDEVTPVQSKDVIQKQQEITVQTISNIEKAVSVTEEDKKKIESASTVSLSDEQQINQLSDDLSEFIQNKVDIDNDDGGKIDRFPTGVDLLDAIMGGGFGVGTFSLVVGNPGTFKSALLGQTIAAGQKKYLGKMLATYHDSESSMTIERLFKLGVKRPKIKPYDDVTVENIFKTIEAISAFKQLRNIIDVPSLVVWDSIANTSTEKEKTTDNINETIGLKARLLSALFPRYLPKLKANKISLIAVNQLREKLDMGQFSAPADLKYMGDKIIPGGQSIKFNAFHLLFLKNKGDIKYEQYGFTGIKLEALCVKNKFFQPNIPIPLLVDFNSGISNFWSNYNYLVDCGKLQSGAWNFLVALPNVKFRTKDVVEKYNSNELGFKDVFDKEVKEAIKTNIIDKYSI